MDKLRAAILRQADNDPTSVAVTDGVDCSITYRDLAELGLAMAGSRSLSGSWRIALAGRGSVALAALMGAAYLTGRQFVVLDDTESADVQLRLLGEFDVNTIVISDHAEVDWRGYAETLSAKSLFGRRPDYAQWDSRASNRDLINQHVSDYAYSVRTSGTSGKPKIIEMRRSSFAHYCHQFAERYRLGPESRLAVTAAPTYDAHYCQLFSALIAGATAVVFAQAIAASGKATEEWLDRQGITHFETTPTILDHVVSAASQERQFPTSLQYILCSGERFPPELAARTFEQADNAGREVHIHNEYGPSECILATWHEIAKADTSLPDIPVGRSITGRKISVDPPDGVMKATSSHPGEVVIESEHLCKGYGTAHSDSLIVFPARGATRIFRTGDLGYIDQRGLLRLVGRRDRTIKRRGVRINLDELEAEFARIPPIDMAAARVDIGDGGSVSIGVWVTCLEPGLSEGDVRRLAVAQLELRYMPDRIVVCEELPRLRSGKIDYLNLPTVKSGGAAATNLGSPLEVAVAHEFAALLPGVEIGADTDFFASGGHSLLALDLAARLASISDSALTLADILRNSTVAALARVLKGPSSDALALVQQPETHELTATERPIWSWCQLFPEDGSANLVAGFSTTAPLDESAVRGSLQALLDEVPQLRLSYPIRHGEPAKLIRERRPLDISSLTVSGSVSGQPHPRVIEQLYKPFDVAKDQLLRALVVRSRQRPGEIAVYLVTHHLVCDGIAIHLLLERIKSILGERSHTTPRLRSQCAQMGRPDAVDAGAARHYWSQIMETLREVPADERLRPANDIGVPPPEMWATDHRPIDDLVRRNRFSRPAIMIGSVAIAIGKILGMPKTVVETPISLRGIADRQTIGNYVVDVPIVVDLVDDDPIFVVHSIDRQLRRALEYAHTAPGFGSLRPGQVAGPVGDAVVVLDHASTRQTEIGRFPVTPIPIAGSPPRHALTFYFHAERDGTLSCAITGRTNPELTLGVRKRLDAIVSELARRL